MGAGEILPGDDGVVWFSDRDGTEASSPDALAFALAVLDHRLAPNVRAYRTDVRIQVELEPGDEVMSWRLMADTLPTSERNRVEVQGSKPWGWWVSPVAVPVDRWVDVAVRDPAQGMLWVPMFAPEKT